LLNVSAFIGNINDAPLRSRQGNEGDGASPGKIEFKNDYPIIYDGLIVTNLPLGTLRKEQNNEYKTNGFRGDHVFLN
jgi:hypothetical protein